MLKRKNDRQPQQRLEEECYPNDYWLDDEDGGEDIQDLAVSSKPVSGRLHSCLLYTSPFTVVTWLPRRGTTVLRLAIREIKLRTTGSQSGLSLIHI